MMLPCDVCGGDCTGKRGTSPCPGPRPLTLSERMAARARVEGVLIESGYMLVSVGRRKATLIQLLDRIIDAARKP